MGHLWCPISWEPRALTKADKHIHYISRHTHTCAQTPHTHIHKNTSILVMGLMETEERKWQLTAQTLQFMCVCTCVCVCMCGFIKYHRPVCSSKILPSQIPWRMYRCTCVSHNPKFPHCWLGSWMSHRVLYVCYHATLDLSLNETLKLNIVNISVCSCVCACMPVCLTLRVCEREGVYVYVCVCVYENFVILMWMV